MSHSRFLAYFTLAIQATLGYLSLDLHVLQADVTFSDQDFIETNWTITTLRDTGSQPAQVTSITENSDGFPASFRKVTHSWTGPGGVTVAHLSDRAVYQTTTHGPISTLSFSFHIVLLEGGSSRGVSYAGLVKQGDAFYQTATALTDTDLRDWAFIELKDLTPSDLVLVGGEGPENPDFSGNIASLKFGFITSNGRSFEGHTRTESGIDNWNVTVLTDDGKKQFTDGEFNPIRWTASKAIDTGPGPASFEISTEVSGGNSKGFRKVTHTWSGPGSIGIVHVRDGESYAPQTKGAIQYVGFTFDLILVDGGSSNAISYSGVIEQAGSLYISPSVSAPNILSGWEPYSLVDLIASDFNLLTGDGPPHPDFSDQGTPIQLGYYTSNGRSVGGSTQTIGGIDNWTVTIATKLNVDSIRVNSLNFEKGRVTADIETSSGNVDIYRTDNLPDFGANPIKSNVAPGIGILIDEQGPEEHAFYHFEPHDEN